MPYTPPGKPDPPKPHGSETGPSEEEIQGEIAKIEKLKRIFETQRGESERTERAMNAFNEILWEKIDRSGARREARRRLGMDDNPMRFAPGKPAPRPISIVGNETRERIPPTDAAVPAEAKKVGGAETKPELDWSEIEISLLSDERVQIRSGAKRETLNYAELGLGDRRTQTPNRAWLTLRLLAEKRGLFPIPDGAKTGEHRVALEKRMQEIRRALRKHFCIPADPLPFVSGTGYQARFKIGRHPASDT